MANNTNWLNISSQSGSSGQTILTLSANKNLSTNYKTAEITAYNPVYNISAKTYVTLEAYSPILSISPGLFGVPDSGGTYELTISANCAWVIAFPDIVTSYSTSAGTGNAVVTFTVPGTTADTTLVGNIVVTDESGQVSRIAKVEQYGSGVHIGIFPVELYFDSTGGSKTFSVTADAAYNVSVGSGTDWAFVEPHSGYTGQTTFTVTVNSENTGTTDKQGVINIDAPGQDLAVILYQRKPETRLVATYYVTSTTDPTRILHNTSSFSKAEYPDGTEITLGTGYTFPTTGYQTVYYTLTESTVGGFQNSEALTSVVIPKGMTVIADNTFSSCSGLTSVTIPNTVTQLGGGSFNQCTSLSSITLPDSLQTIAGSAFRNCTSLSSITIPSTVTNIGTNCFSGSSVSSITFTSLTPPTLRNAKALSSSSLSEIIVPCPAVNDYITAWPQYAQYISCSETGTTLYFTTDTSNVKGTGETRTITILNTNINPNRTGLNLPSDFPQQGSYTVVGNTIYITYPKNPSSSATRSWTIGVVAQTNDGVSLSGSYHITQNANVTYSIPYTADTSTVNKTGETRTITIDTSNLIASSVTVGVEGATGISYTYENGVVTVIFPTNEGGEKNVTVSINGETLDGNYAYATVSYTQENGIWLQYIVTYDVTQTTGTTKICNNTTSFASIEYPEGTEIPKKTTFTFPSTGIQTVYFYSKTTTLSASAFSGCSRMISIIVPEGVTEIGKAAFKSYSTSTGYTNLSAVTLPTTLTSIGESAFDGCSSLTGITLPSGITVIPKRCFDDCNNLTHCDISSNITSFGDYCFNFCRKLENITIPNSVTGLGASCFFGCSGISNPIVIPSGVTTIPNGCFYDCNKIANIDLGNVETIGYSAFSWCQGFSSITIPDSVTSIGNACFGSCTKLESVTLGSGITSLGGLVFSECTNLSSITIPANVTTIGSRCFGNCTKLKDITIPDKVTSIADGCFLNCSGLTAMTFNGIEPPTLANTGTVWYDASLGDTAYTFPIYVPCQSIDAYKTAFASKYASRILCPSLNVTALTLNLPAYIVGPYSATVTYEPESASTSFMFSSDSMSVSVNENGVVTALGGSPGGGVANICVKDAFTQLQDCKTVTAYSSASSMITYQYPSDGEIPVSGGTGYVKASNIYGFQPGTIGFSVSGNGLTYVQNDNRLDITFPANKFSKRQVYKITVSGLSWNGNVYREMVSYTQTGKIFTGGTMAATYYVTSTTNPTKIINNTSQVSKAEYPQGTEITLGTGYTFPSTGLQTVYFTLTGGTVDGFRECADLVSITLPDDIESISDWAFDSCQSLSAVNINSGSSLLYVYGGAFWACHNLKSFTFPKDLYQLGGSIDDSIGRYNHPFDGCPITSLTSYATVEPILDIKFSGSGLKPFGTLFYPCGSDYSTWLSDDGNLGYLRWYDACFTPGQPMPTPHIPAGQDLEVFVTYNVTQTTGNTKILSHTGTYVSAELVDGGVSIPLGTGYTFPSTGLQTIKYTLSNDTYTVAGFNSVKIESIIMPTCVFRLGAIAFQGATVNEMTFYALKAPHFTSRAHSTASGTDSGTFKFLSSNGVLRYPAGSDYSSYLDPLSCPNGWNPGTFGWTGIEME